MLPHVKRSSIEAVVRGSAARRLVFAQGPGRGLQALRWALPSGVSRALPEKLLLKHGVSACQKPPALAGGVVTCSVCASRRVRSAQREFEALVGRYHVTSNMPATQFQAPRGTQDILPE